MTKFNYCLFMAVLSLVLAGCNDDEIAAPPKPSFQASATTAQVGQDITFTINEVSADAISLLPYGTGTSDPGILISDFSGGKATVTFAYARPGAFQAVVVANNHSKDGANVENVLSDPVTITVSSSDKSISAFSFADIDTETTIDEDAHTIAVVVPYGTDVSDLKATFTASPFATVSVGGTEQESGTTANDFSSPLVYRVTADDGSTNDYTVTVSVTPVETTNTIESVTATAVSASSDEKQLGVSVDNTARTIVIYDTLGTASAQFDSVQIAYALDGAFSVLKYNGQKMLQDTVIDLTADQEFQVYSQDSASAGGIQTYNVYAVAAPKLGLSFPGLVPDPAEAVKPTNFTIDIPVLAGTDVTSINTLASTSSPAGVSVTGMKVDGATFVSGSPVDYSEPVEFALTVNDLNRGVTYTVTYTVTVTVVP